MLEEVFIKVSIQSLLVMNLEEDERFIMCLAALFVHSRINDDAMISIKSSTMEIVHSAEVMAHKQKNSGLGRKDN